MRKSLLGTYIKIIIAVLIIVALIYGAIKFLYNEYDKQEYETVKTNMLLIQNKTEIIAQKVEIKEKDAKCIGTKIKEKENNEDIQNLINNKIIDIKSKEHNYYCLDNSNLKELGLENIEIDNFYIVDYEKNDIIYVDGIEDSTGNVIYKLSEMK